jgi:hypothetical protein
MLVPDFSVVKLARQTPYRRDADMMAGMPNKPSRKKSPAAKSSVSAASHVKAETTLARKKA